MFIKYIHKIFKTVLNTRFNCIIIPPRKQRYRTIWSLNRYKEPKLTCLLWKFQLGLAGGWNRNCINALPHLLNNGHLTAYGYYASFKIKQSFPPEHNKSRIIYRRLDLVIVSNGLLYLCVFPFSPRFFSHVHFNCFQK